MAIKFVLYDPLNGRHSKQISCSVKQEVIDAINHLRESNQKKVQKIVPGADEISFSEMTAILLASHPDIIKRIPKK